MSRAFVPAVIVHGGAGLIAPEKRAAHRAGAERAAEAGLVVLRGGGSALDAAQRAVELLEDDPIFNAGTGACLTGEGTIELDAAVMEGTTLRAGAVTVLPPFAHPIRIARAVLEQGRHVLYAGAGAAAFAEGAGFAPSSLEAMRTQAAVERLARYQQGKEGEGWAGGTVGAVALDALGHLAAATSTGGTVGKQKGRVGDTPLLGAGTYADDLAGAASATGIGEAIMRACLTRTATDLTRQGMPAQRAAEAAIATFADRFGGSGGVILIDPRGRTGAAWNTETMTHAIAREGSATSSAC